MAQTKNDPGLGIEFEVFLPAYFCLKLIENEDVEDFSVESNAPGFGNVDDLVFHITNRDQNELFFALQLKHAEKNNAKLYPTSFWSEENKSRNDDFKLKKYCKTFTDFDEEKRKYHVILFTNRMFDPKKAKDVKNFTMEQHTNCEGRRYFDTSSSDKSIYKFSLKDTSESNTDFQEFFEKFSLYTSQWNSRNLESKINEIFANNYHAHKFVTAAFINFFRSWHKGEFTNKKLTKHEVKMQLIQFLLSSCIENRLSIACDVDRRKNEILKTIVCSFDIITVETLDFLREDHNHDLALLRLAKDLKIVKRDAKNLTLDEYCDTLICTGQKPIVVKLNETSKKSIYAVLNRILRKNPMKMIICGANIDVTQLEAFQVFNNLENLLLKHRNLFFDVVDNFEISLQGRRNVLMKQLIGEESSQLITAEDLLKSAKGELVIGDRNEAVIEHYVPRILTAPCVSFEFVVQLKRDLLVIDCGDMLDRIEDKLHENTIKTVCRIEDFRDDIKADAIILTKSNTDMEFRHANTHFLKAVDEDSFQWIMTRGDIQNLRSGGRSGVKEISEEDVVGVFKNNKVNVVCAEPGMGKSVLMEVLKKYSPDDHWTAKIDFREFSQIFKMFNNKNRAWEEAFYKKVFDNSDKFKKIAKKIHVFFDGLDELQSRHVETAMKFIESLVTRGFKIWISSRRNLQDLLETRFNVFALNIQQFTEDVQRIYIESRLSRFYDFNTIHAITQKIFENAKVFNNCEILGIPLQLSMLTEILIENRDLARDFNEKIFVMTEMFESFFEAKIKHYLLKITSDIETLQEDYVKFHAYYEVAALKSCLDENFYKTLKITESRDCREFIETDPSKLGIVTKINDDGVAVFQHNTHAEYFAACYFADNYHNLDLKKIFEAKYNNIRLMFDIKLAEDSLPHLAVIYRDFSRLKTLNFGECEDKGGRTLLHLACCYGEQFPILSVDKSTINDHSSDSIDRKNLKLNYQIIKFLHNAKISVFIKDRVFKWNSLQYSDAILNLSAIDILISDDSVDLKKNLERYSKSHESLIYYATKFNFKNIFAALKRVILGNSKINIFKILSFQQLLRLKTDNGESLLHIATESRNAAIVELLLNEGVSVNSIDHYDRTPFDIAVLVNDDEIQTILASKGGKPECLQKYKNHPLQWASKNNFVKVVRLLVLETEIDVNNCDDLKWTSLHHAVRYGHVGIINFLLDSGADIEARTNMGETPLLLGIYYGQVDAINLLLMRGACIDAIKNNGETPLQCAIIKNHDAALKLLLKKRVNVKTRNNVGETALHLAAKYNNREAIRVLLDTLTREDVDLECRSDQGETALHYAASSSFEVFKLLLESGGDVNATSSNSSCETVLHLATISQNLAVIDYILDHGFDVNAVNANDDTALHCAASENKIKALRFLIEKRATLFNLNKDGLAPIHLAVKNSHLRAIGELLLDDGMIDAVTSRAETPLHLAVSEENLDVAKFLVGRGAFVKTRNGRGESLVHCAVSSGNRQVFEYVLGLDVDVCGADFGGVTPLGLSVEMGLEGFESALRRRGADLL